VNQHTRTLKIKLRLTPVQEHTLTYQASHARYVYNWGLARRQEVYKATGKGLTYVQQSAELTKLKAENRWLFDTYSDTLQHALKDLETAYKNFFERRARYPRFKSRHKVRPSLKYAKGAVLESNRIKLPKLGWVRCFNSHEHGAIKSVRVKQTAAGDWYATCVTEFVPLPPKPVQTACGIDLGLNSFAVITDGETYHDVAPPKFFREYEAKLAKAQKKLSRCERGSNRRAKTKLAVAKLHKRIANLRANWLHQLSNRIVNEYDAVMLEDLNIKGMARGNLGKSLGDAALSEFVRQLEYKAAWRGKAVQKIDRWFPSSKLHAACGVVNKELERGERLWLCDCGETIARDENAALNILKEGLNVLSGSDSATLKPLRWGKTSNTLAPVGDARIPPL